MRIVSEDRAFPTQLLCRKAVAWESLSSWQSVETKGFPFLRRGAPTALRRPERHIAYIPLILFLISTLLWHMSENRTVSTFIFCSSCFPAKDQR